MKNLIFLLSVAVLFAACSNSDHNIDSRFISQQCVSMTQETIAGLDPGMHFVGTPNNDGLSEVCDSMYTVSPSFDQKVALAKADGTYTWGIVLFVACIALILLGAWWGYNSPSGSYTFLIAIFAGIGGGMWGADLLDWAHTKQADITKVEYMNEMNSSGNLEAFWNANLTK